MTSFKVAGAAAVLSLTIAAAIATPVFAQAAVQEPGAYAFYHPDADVLNGRRSRDRSANAMASVPFGGSNVRPMERNAKTSSCARRHRSYDLGSETFLGYDGRRHSCE
jgi:BA14K-like protein